jgi:hypothetical protein
MQCWTRSETLHNLPEKSEKQASEAWGKFLHACHDNTCDERDLIGTYQEMARFAIHASLMDLHGWMERETQKLSGSDRNRFQLTCRLLSLVTYDPEKEKAFDSREQYVDLSAPVEPMLAWTNPRDESEFYSTNFRISNAGPTEAYNQIGQSGYA